MVIGSRERSGQRKEPGIARPERRTTMSVRDKRLMTNIMHHVATLGDANPTICLLTHSAAIYGSVNPVDAQAEVVSKVVRETLEKTENETAESEAPYVSESVFVYGAKVIPFGQGTPALVSNMLCVFLDDIVAVTCGSGNPPSTAL
jgi:hypothetical protein